MGDHSLGDVPCYAEFGMTDWDSSATDWHTCMFTAAGCPAGFSGYNCEIDLLDSSECQTDQDCPSTKYCSIANAAGTKTKCQNPCSSVLIYYSKTKCQNP